MNGVVSADQWNEQRRQIFYPKTDGDFDLNEVRRRKEEIAKADFERGSLPVILRENSVSDLQPVPGGTFHALFKFHTPSRNFILKVATEPMDYAFNIEEWMFAKLRTLGLPGLDVPAYSVIPAAVYPFPFLIVEEAKGKPLNSLEDPQSQALPEPLLFEIGRTFAQIHQIEAEGGGLINVRSLGPPNPASLYLTPRGLHSDWRSYIRTRLSEHIQTCVQIGAMDSSEARTTEAHFSKASALLSDAPLRLLHGDPGHHNVFSDGRKITAIIDWEDALAGDPIFDIAYWGTFVRDEMRARFLEGYVTIEKLPSDFEDRYWLYYLRIALSKTVHRHRFGTKDRSGRPASQRIQKALSNLAKL